MEIINMEKNLSDWLLRLTLSGMGVILPLVTGCASREIRTSSEVLPDSGISSTEISQVLAFHNRKRQEVGSPNLSWSSEIARYAQKRADTIARSGRFGHLPRGMNPYGENLAEGGSTRGASGYSVLDACQAWYAEKSLMPAGERILSKKLFNRGVGHYTQMVWKGTTEMGAGVAHYQKGGYNVTVVVCCYNPRGNVITEAIY